MADPHAAWYAELARTLQVLHQEVEAREPAQATEAHVGLRGLLISARAFAAQLAEAPDAPVASPPPQGFVSHVQRPRVPVPVNPAAGAPLPPSGFSVEARMARAEASGTAPSSLLREVANVTRERRVGKGRPERAKDAK